MMSTRQSCNASLTPVLETFSDGRVASSRYHSASEVVRTAPRLLRHTDVADREREGCKRNGLTEAFLER